MFEGDFADTFTEKSEDPHQWKRKFQKKHQICNVCFVYVLHNLKSRIYPCIIHNLHFRKKIIQANKVGRRILHALPQNLFSTITSIFPLTLSLIGLLFDTWWKEGRFACVLGWRSRGSNMHNRDPPPLPPPRWHNLWMTKIDNHCINIYFKKDKILRDK